MKRGLPVPSRRVFLDVFEQEHLYELNLKDNKVERHAKTDDLGDEYEIFRMSYAMLLAFLTRHVSWSYIEEDIHYYRQPDIYDENLDFIMNFLAL